MFGRLIVEEKSEDTIVDFSVHDHGLEHRTLPDDELDHPIDQTQLGSVDGNAHRHLGLVHQFVVLLLLVWILEGKK